MLFLDTTPDTSFYMLLGYAVFLLGPALYIATWFLRRRNLQKDRELYHSLAAENKKPPQ